MSTVTIVTTAVSPLQYLSRELKPAFDPTYYAEYKALSAADKVGLRAMAVEEMDALGIEHK